MQARICHVVLRQWLLASLLQAALHDILDRREPLEQALERKQCCVLTCRALSVQVQGPGKGVNAAAAGVLVHFQPSLFRSESTEPRAKASGKTTAATTTTTI